MTGQPTSIEDPAPGPRAYRAFYLSHDGKVEHAEMIDTETDDEAKTIAARLVNGHGVDLWERARSWRAMHRSPNRSASTAPHQPPMREAALNYAQTLTDAAATEEAFADELSGMSREAELQGSPNFAAAFMRVSRAHRAAAIQKRALSGAILRHHGPDRGTQEECDG